MSSCSHVLTKNMFSRSYVLTQKHVLMFSCLKKNMFLCSHVLKKNMSPRSLVLIKTMFLCSHVFKKTCLPVLLSKKNLQNDNKNCIFA